MPRSAIVMGNLQIFDFSPKKKRTYKENDDRHISEIWGHFLQRIVSVTEIAKLAFGPLWLAGFESEHPAVLLGVAEDVSSAASEDPVVVDGVCDHAPSHGRESRHRPPANTLARHQLHAAEHPLGHNGSHLNLADSLLCIVLSVFPVSSSPSLANQGPFLS